MYIHSGLGSLQNRIRSGIVQLPRFSDRCEESITDAYAHTQSWWGVVHVWEKLLFHPNLIYLFRHPSRDGPTNCNRTLCDARKFFADFVECAPNLLPAFSGGPTAWQTSVYFLFRVCGFALLRGFVWILRYMDASLNFKSTCLTSEPA